MNPFKFAEKAMSMTEETWVNNIWGIVLGNTLVILPKVWSVDRMVWIYQDMKDTDPEFIRWLKP